ncbi:MAG: Crp/Fnr family transcriptional regulator [Betaproteobacteria bacterium]|nr:MAG: Crp/Fnr family transcriptional regulator [Betaproteobacteria bacterium]TMI00526.1 MAG: Crp/Fnr family transcriptional regulator [Betaproteobacteria bacterium]TMI09714.1 MAG: Crp/Fnr family transcriptional regulator [Betaproteobacteria bacterium]TMI40822.1 MAG: Crp/Fnr family transcriptional regulator [Betaproteobacteria bacterium]
MLADLKRIPLFEGLPDEDLLMIAQRVAIRNVPESEVIVREGDRTDALYMILSGKVKVYLGEEGGKEIPLDVKGPGQYFGEMTLDDKPRAASVMSLQPSRLAEISGADVRALLLKHPETALHLIRNLIRVTRGLNERARESGRKREKLRGYIDELGTKSGADSPDVKRWAKAKRWILAILLVCAVLQYYFFDVFTEMMSLGGVNTFTGN